MAPQCAPASESPSRVPRVQGGLVGHREVAVAVVEERRVDHAVAVLGGELVEQDLHRGDAPLPGDGRDRGRGVGLVVDVGAVDGPHAPDLVEHHALEEAAVVGHLVHQPAAALRVGEGLEPLGHRQVGDLGVGGVEEQRVHAAVQAVEDADGAARHLGDDVEALAWSACVEQAEHRAPHLRVLVGLVEVHAHGATRPTGQGLHPRPLLHRHEGVVGCELEDAVPGTRAAHRRWRGARRPRRSCPAPARRPWSGAAACGSWRSRARRPAAPPRRARPWRGCRLRSRARWPRPGRPSRRRGAGRGRSARRRRAPSARPPTASRYSGNDVHSQVMPSVMADPGMSSTPFHELDEPGVAVGGRWREADAAVAHHHGGDAVPGARGDPRVPGDLGVVVGVDVDPARA